MNQPKYKICRRLGAQVFGKCENPKFLLKSAAKGVKSKSGKRGPRQFSEFGLQMFEKQKARFFYGLSERQFANYVKKAAEKKGTNPSFELYTMLETRLDNVVFRLGFAKTRAFARQLVTHGHIMVNGRKINFPSYEVKAGDMVGIREGSREKGPFLTLSERLKEYTEPAWLSLEKEKKEGKMIASPGAPDEGGLLFNLASVVEFYSR